MKMELKTTKDAAIFRTVRSFLLVGFVALLAGTGAFLTIYWSPAEMRGAAVAVVSGGWLSLLVIAPLFAMVHRKAKKGGAGAWTRFLERWRAYLADEEPATGPEWFGVSRDGRGGRTSSTHG